MADVEAARSARALRYEEDDHYDVISAFIKCIRGSDPDAGLYWLARMLAAGEDARFIARRLVILASEDVGMADPMALGRGRRRRPGRGVRRAARSPAQPGPGRRPPGHRPQVQPGGLGHLGGRRPTWPTSPTGQVPAHLRDAHYRGARRVWATARATTTPTTTPGAGWTSSTCPITCKGGVYYEPSEHGAEADLARRADRSGEAASPPLRR